MPFFDIYFNIGSPPCRAVLITAKLLGLGECLRFHYVDLLANESLKPEFKKANPIHTIPLLYDGKFKIWESRAIMAYLCDKYGGGNNPLYPRDPQKRAQVDMALYFDIERLAPNIHGYALKLIRHMELAPDALEKVEISLEQFEGIIGNKTFVAGERVTIADISIRIVMHELELVQYDFSKYPNINAWMNRTATGIPFYKQTQKKFLEYAKKVAAERGIDIKL
ncbi:glutathione S-transferase 1-like [Lineus longissimus]|uniref:glutathione S-transferase 1-like n=1 Tax=Lineus longissimus TaxID=88925 RepID=UPI002B4F3595